jgi:hypothetical protein
VAAAIAALGLAASGCAQSMSEFARNADQKAAPAAYPAPGDPQTMPAARPAVLVDEATVPVSRQSPQTTRTSAPMKISPPQADVASAEQPDEGSAHGGTARQGNRSPRPRTQPGACATDSVADAGREGQGDR